MNILKQIENQKKLAKDLGFSSWNELSEYTKQTTINHIYWIKIMAKYELMCNKN